MAVFSQNVVLSKEHTVDTTHQTTSFTVQIGVDLLFKRGLVDVTGTNGDSQGNGLFFGLAGDVVPDGVGGVNTSALLEQGSDGSTGTLWSSQDDVDVGWWVNLGQLLEDWGETVGEVKGLAFGQERLDVGPGGRLGSVRQQVHDNGTLLDGFVDREQVLTWDPSIFDGGLPGGTVLSDTDDDVQAVISQVQTLAVTLGTVTNQGHCVVLEVLQQLFSWPVGSFVNQLFNTAEVNLLQASDSTDVGSSNVGSSNVGASSSRRNQGWSLGHRREGSGGGSGRSGKSSSSVSVHVSCVKGGYVCEYRREERRREEREQTGAKKQKEEADKRDCDVQGKWGLLYTSSRGGESESGQREKLDAAGRCRRQRPV